MSTSHPAAIVRRSSQRLLVVLLLIGIFGLAGRHGVVAQRDAMIGGAVTLTGEVVVSNPLLTSTLSEPFILLADLSNFLARDIDGAPALGPQVVARLEGSLASGATFSLPLPMRPPGTAHHFDPHMGERTDSGVKVFSVELNNNVVGEPFFGPFEVEQGWGTSFSSMRVESGSYEVIGGSIVVWAEQAGEAFPSGFGEDGKLFTADDPKGALLSGWTVIDLDVAPFGLGREAVASIQIIEGESGLRDLSELGYTAAFDALVAELRVRYPFTATKRIDWDGLVTEFRPQIEAAERERDAAGYHRLLDRFALRFQDGHVAVEPPFEDLRGRFGGSAGMTLGLADDGTVIVAAVARRGPAASAGIERGATIVALNDRPVAVALAEQEIVRPASSPHVLTEQRLRLLPAGMVGQALDLRYRNPGGEEDETRLSLSADRSVLRAIFASSAAPAAELPVTVEVLDSGIGYVRVSTFLADLALMAASWEWAIERLNALGVPAVIVDVRGNLGGAGLLAGYFAGSFTAEPFDLAEYRFAKPSGELVFSGTFDIQPTPSRWERPVAVLIDGSCASACEIFAAAVARDPEHLIVGQTPTAGVLASVFPWRLPGGILFQAPLGRLEAGGEVFVEGVGVAPSLDVPITIGSLTREADDVLDAAEDALLAA